ncbi:hypothetical protein LSCM1_00105 [Leishmania martiniquensis]|uniref:Transmembrane protein n=1 Tax=Leishmania martiniquensis TaxID=1580590 RepID=A0A836FJX1_9TRYP|nr:hypothetical protein LSCM1_00105 [Leishmania martiniquensis]
MSLMGMMLRLACMALIVAAFGLLSSEASGTAPSHENRALMVTIENGVLPEAKALAQLRHRLGEWAYNFNPGEEASFFEAEDAASLQWEQRKAELARLQSYREKQRLDNYAAGSDEMNASAKGNTQGRGQATLAIADYFSERNVQRRQKARLKKQSLYNLSDVNGVTDARIAVEGEIAALLQRVQLAGASDTANDQQFLGLVERHFSHTIVNRSALEAATPLPSLQLALLRVPLVLDAEVLPFMERELGYLQDLWKLRRAEETALATSSGNAESHLRFLLSVVEESRAVSAKVAALAEPLADATVRWAISTLTATREAIVTNDESTEAKRAELKRLLKQQSGLRRMKPLLEKYNKEYLDSMRRGQLLSAEATLFALSLIAKQRFGDDVSGVLEVVPTLSITAPLTGLLEKEWRVHVLAPYGMCALVTAAFAWLCEELKERCLSRVRASRLCPPTFSARGVIGSPSSRRRQVFIFVSLLELIVPPILPVVMLMRQLRGARPLMLGLLAAMRPGQCAMCLACVAVLMGINHLVTLVVQRVFQAMDPSVYRRHLAKKK